MNKRPTILTILSILYIAGGVLGLIIAPILIVLYLCNKAELPFITPLTIIISIFLLSILALTSGIGILKRKKWGWWLGALYYAYSVLRHIYTIIVLPGLVETFGEPPKGIEHYYLKHGFRGLLHLLILLYFFRKSVLEYFELEQQSKPKAIAILFGVAIVIIGGFIVAQLV